MTRLTDAEFAGRLRAILREDAGRYEHARMPTAVADAIQEAARRLEAIPSTSAQGEITEAMKGSSRVTLGDQMWVRDRKQPWTKCPSTHCERSGECRSPRECSARSVVGGFGVALRMIAEGCADPKGTARAALEAALSGKEG